MQWRTRSIGLIVCLVWVAVAVIGCAGNRTSQSTGEFIDDSTLANKVKVALYADDEVKGTQVEVEAFKGVVQLSGFVDNMAQSQKAEQIAWEVNGVQNVRNNLIVR
jgi:osmotically-inducible protein OsmY